MLFSYFTISTAMICCTDTFLGPLKYFMVENAQLFLTEKQVVLKILMVRFLLIRTEL